MDHSYREILDAELQDKSFALKPDDDGTLFSLNEQRTVIEKML